MVFWRNVKSKWAYCAVYVGFTCSYRLVPKYKKILENN